MQNPWLCFAEHHEVNTVAWFLTGSVPLSGSFWAGDLYRARCGFVENSHLRLFITGHDHKYYFGSRVGITASFVVKYPWGSGMHTDSYKYVTSVGIGRLFVTGLVVGSSSCTAAHKFNYAHSCALTKFSTCLQGFSVLDHILAQSS